MALAGFEADSFRAQGQRQRLALRMMIERFLHRDGAAVELDAVPARFADRGFQHVERADERCHEARGRAVIDVERRADLVGAAFMHDHDAVGDRQRFFLIMSDENGRNAELLLDGADFFAQRDADFGIECR